MSINDSNDEQAALLSLLEATIDATSEGLLVVDLAGKIVASNRRFAELWNIPEEMLARRDDAELLDYARNQLVSPEQFINRVHDVYANREAETSDILEFRDGRTLARSSRPQRIKGKISGNVWSFRDITAQVRSEAARNEAFEKEQHARAEAEDERRHAEILADSSRLLAESLDYETTVRTIQSIVVPRFADWSGLGIQESEGCRLIGFRAEPDDPAFAERIVRNTILDRDAPQGIPLVIRTGKSVLFRSVAPEDLTSRDGRWPILGTRDPNTLAAVREIGLRSFMIVPLAVRGKVIGAMSLASTSINRLFDESDLRRAEELGRRCAIALDSANLYRDAIRTIRVREDFLSVASHELRTPLSPLRMQFEMAHLFAQEIPDSFEKRAELLEMIEGAGLQLDRLLKLVDNLLDVSRITAGRLKIHAEWFDFAALVHEVVKRFAPVVEKSGCELQLNIPDRLEGYWDRSRIDQVVSNLLSNALKFGAGFPVELHLARIEDEARLSVKNYGVGIAPADQERIFERFERGTSSNATAGFGLGLYICREIVVAHSGKITVESEPESGTLFTIRLPLRRRNELTDTQL